MARLLLGDSNIIKYLPLLKEKKSDPAIQSTVMARTTNAVTLQDALCHPKSAHTTVIVSALTNLLTAKYFDDFDDMTIHCKNVFNDLLLWIQEGRDVLDGFAQQVTLLLSSTLYMMCDNQTQIRYLPMPSKCYSGQWFLRKVP
jgi:hypothetical protein